MAEQLMAPLSRVGAVIQPAGVSLDSQYYGDNKSRVGAFSSLRTSQ